MKLLLENWRQFLNEEVYGNLITVYSRTTSEDIIAKIASEGWKVGSYGDYGPAIYMQYSFEPSDYADRTYGTHVMKFALRANNKLLILGDKEAAKKVFGKELSAEEQLRLFAPESLEDKSIAEWVESTRRSESFSGYTMPVEKLKKYINGILLVNRKDGRVAIIYKPDGVLTMLSWAKIPKGYKFKSDDEQRKQQAYERAMEDIVYAVEGEYDVPYGDPRLKTVEGLIDIIKSEEVERSQEYAWPTVDPEVSKLSNIEDIVKFLGLEYLLDIDPDEPVYRMHRTTSHEKDYSDVKYDKGSLSWKKEIKGITLPKKVKLA
tara:strand:+ start:228 stop:1184 length:957 start_codon:yes stop_codon:yes gene_type:complete